MSDSSVEFSVKELFQRIDLKMDWLNSAVQQKADKADLDKEIHAVEKRLADVERELSTKVAADQTEQRYTDTNRRITNNRNIMVLGLIGLLMQFGGLIALFLKR